MHFNQWAARWGISAEAIAELVDLVGVNFAQVSSVTGLSEAAVQNNVRLEAAHEGCRLMRNNVGVFTDKRGVPVRYGLANESKKMNTKIKSSDLIGINPVTITPEMVGLLVGIFTARECKPEGWQFSGTKHENAQLNFGNLINSLGGDFKFTTGNF